MESSNVRRVRSAETLATAALMAAVSPLLGGANGCGPVFSNTPAPDMTGVWDVAYENDLDVVIRLGGSVYTATVGAQGGVVVIDHDGQPITFDLDCDRPEVICPSEVWPAYVTVRQDDPYYPHRIWVTIPQQHCSGLIVPADPSECGPGTLNEACEDVCEGAIVTTETETFGVIDEPGQSFDLLLGGGVATNGINCALLAWSAAHADLVTTGSADTDDWEAHAMLDGEVVAGYAGACLWAGDPDGDAQLEALVLGASVELRTAFSGEKR